MRRRLPPTLDLMEEAIALFAWFVTEVVLVQTGRLVVCALSLGRWRGEALERNEERVHAPAGALWFDVEGQRVVSGTGLLFVGVAFYVLLALGLLTYAVGA